MCTQILIVEDEPAVADAIAYTLRQEGYEVSTAEDGAAALARLAAAAPDLVILDILLPGCSGFDVCREIRRTSKVPVIMLTARGEEIDRIVGFELGADDYVTKPFSMRELVARVRACLRRAGSEEAATPLLLRSDDLELDLSRCRVTLRGQWIRLNRREFDILWFLMSRQGQVVTREEILDAVWGPERYRDPRNVDVHIRTLRQRIEENPGFPRRILTVYGVGYRFVG